MTDPGAGTQIRAEHDPAVLTQLHASLIVPSFPPEERGSAEELVATVRQGRFTVLVARPGVPGHGRTAADEPSPHPATGLAVIETWPEVPGAALLAWLAVRRDTRSRGIGRALLQRTLRHAAGRLLLAEIEPASTPARNADYGDPAARAAFYARHGARVVDLPYWQPPVRPEAPPVRLDLIVIPPPGSTVPEQLAAEPTRSVLEAYAIPHLPTDLAEPLRQACAAPTLRTRPLR
ncbi:GNAT family N-acetyltransferase [Propioniciclava sinopodophylli]|uniref:GNAT family N-acetyltransferase n=1 Tax=Propioniciclava sinopodophylli TaxID=1837344 RepID=UPI002490749F|nr:GNAT family N-acetyltransferase [Propioniciclava sinopodophylli]